MELEQPQQIPFEIISIANREDVFTDIHVQTDQVPMVRKPAGWVEAEDIEIINTGQAEQFLSELTQMPKDRWELELNHNGAISRAIDLFSCRLRVNAYRVNAGTGYSFSIRRQPLVPDKFDQIGLPKFLTLPLDMHKGLILVTGQTGSGKTTTLASMVDYLNNSRPVHIITIEDPVEYVHQRAKAIFSHKEIPVDAPSFAEGLRQSLRQKPDVIMVGEIRDRDTAETSMMAAESGHLVLASMHTNSAIGAIQKMLAFFPHDEISHRSRMLGSSLLAIVTQSLVPSADQQSFVLASEILANHAQQCTQLIENPERHSQLADFMRRSDDKMTRTLNFDLARLVRENQITDRDAQRFTNDRADLMSRLSARV